MPGKGCELVVFLFHVKRALSVLMQVLPTKLTHNMWLG